MVELKMFNMVDSAGFSAELWGSKRGLYIEIYKRSKVKSLRRDLILEIPLFNKNLKIEKVNKILEVFNFTIKQEDYNNDKNS